MLIGNYSVFNKCPGKWRAGTSTCDRSSFNQPGMSRGMFYNDASVVAINTGTLSATHLLTTYGIPSGTVAWVIPQTSGGMAMRSLGVGAIVQNLIPQQPTSTAMTGSGSMTATIYGLGNLLCALTGSNTFTTAITASGNLTIDVIGSGGISADILGNGNVVFNATGSGTLTGAASLFYNMLVAMTGSGTLSADASLLVSMLCDMTGSNTMSMNITGQLHPTCSMTGTGTLDGNMTAFANMLVDLLGSGTLTESLTAIANMSIDIVVTGTGLTTANVGSAVWSAIASQNDEAGTMGEIMNNMGAVSDPWSTLLPGSYTTGQAGYVLGNLLSNIPDSVWDELKTTHTTSDSYGKLVSDIEKLAKQIKALTAAGL